jgi:hypothetical protein
MVLHRLLADLQSVPDDTAGLPLSEHTQDYCFSGRDRRRKILEGTQYPGSQSRAMEEAFKNKRLAIAGPVH